MNKILCVGIAPALQRTLVFDRFEPGGVNRAIAVKESAAGKALNVARVLAQLEMPALATGFNGGQVGERVCQLAAEHKVETFFTPAPIETRICTTVIERDIQQITELVEEASDPGVESIRCFKAEIAHCVKSALLVGISGTLPPFADTDLYITIAEAARRADVPLMVDSHGKALLCLLPFAPLLVKLNSEELGKTLHTSNNNDAELWQGMQQLRALGARNLLVTQGAKRAWLLCDQKLWAFTPPALQHVCNPIGSGDATMAGIICNWLQESQHDLVQAVSFGIACGSANVETITPGEIVVERAYALAQQVHSLQQPLI